MRRKDLKPYFPIAMIGETDEDRRAIKDALSLGYFLWVTEDGKVLREADYKYIAYICLPNIHTVYQRISQSSCMLKSSTRMCMPNIYLIINPDRSLRLRSGYFTFRS